MARSGYYLAMFSLLDHDIAVNQIVVLILIPLVFKVKLLLRYKHLSRTKLALAANSFDYYNAVKPRRKVI